MTDPYWPFMAPAFDLVVFGTPGPQGSKRHVGNGRMIESSKKVKPWRDAVHKAALFNLPTDWEPLEGPLRARMVFTLPAPKKIPKERLGWPSTVPDLSKLLRSTEDALTTSRVWRDDGQVVAYDQLEKRYVGGENALHEPGVVLAIWYVQ